MDIKTAENIKNYVRETVTAFQDGAGSQDAPMTADLAIAAIWRHIDVIAGFEAGPESISRLRIEAPQKQRIDVIMALGELNPDTVHQVGGRQEKHNDVWYVWIPTKGIADVLEALKVLKKAGADVRDWQYYDPA